MRGGRELHRADVQLGDGLVTQSQGGAIVVKAVAGQEADEARGIAIVAAHGIAGRTGSIGERGMVGGEAALHRGHRIIGLNVAERVATDPEAAG